MVLGREAASPPLLFSGAGSGRKGAAQPRSTWQDPWFAVLGLVAGFLCFSARQELEQLGEVLHRL